MRRCLIIGQYNQILSTISPDTIPVPNRKRIGHVDVAFFSTCSHVWMGGGGKGIIGARQGAERG
jgi:hypothetical protein